MKNQILQQCDYHNWANRRILEHLKELPDEVYDNEIKSVFSTIKEVVEHIYHTDGMWFSVISGDSFDETMAAINQLKENTAGRDVSGMEALYEEMNEKYTDFLVSRDDLEAPFSIEHPKYGKLETTIPQLVKHVVNHGTYHRGNITAMIRQQGHAGTPTDYVFYLNEMKNGM